MLALGCQIRGFRRKEARYSNAYSSLLDYGGIATVGEMLPMHIFMSPVFVQTASHKGPAQPKG